MKKISKCPNEKTLKRAKTRFRVSFLLYKLYNITHDFLMEVVL